MKFLRNLINGDHKKKSEFFVHRERIIIRGPFWQSAKIDFFKHSLNKILFIKCVLGSCMCVL